MLKKLLSAGAAILAAATTACEDGPATVAGGWRSPATWSAMVHASASGPVLVTVAGAAFAMDQDDFVRSTVAAMSNQLPGRVVAFTADPAAAAKPNIRVSLLFNPPATADAKDLCAGEASPQPQDAEKIRVLAAFCDKSGLLSSVGGWVAKVQSPDDPRFRRLLGQVVRDLFGSPN